MSVFGGRVRLHGFQCSAQLLRLKRAGAVRGRALQLFQQGNGSEAVQAAAVDQLHARCGKNGKDLDLRCIQLGQKRRKSCLLRGLIRQGRVDRLGRLIQLLCPVGGFSVKKISRRSFLTVVGAAAATAALTACGGSSSSTAASTSSAASTAAPAATASNASVVLKFDLTVSLEHPWGLAATEFKNRIEEKSGGSMTVEIYPSSTSGSEADSLAGMLVGTTSMTMSGGSFNGYAPSATLLEAPWAYNSEEDVQAMCESDIGKGIMQDFEDAGFKVLWYQLRGPRELTSNVPINKASDLQGRKMRMSGNVLHNSMWTAAGAITSAIALSETFNALSQGVVEMQENPYDMIYDNSFYEVQKYVNQTNHVYSTIFNLLSVDIWNGLSEDQQNIITETSNEMQDWTNEYYFAHKDEYLEKLKETGMQVNEDVDRDDIKNAMMPAIEEFLKSQPGDLWTTYQAICDLSNS